eukprot:767712-Hanusia_phi.AAC.8
MPRCLPARGARRPPLAYLLLATPVAPRSPAGCGSRTPTASDRRAPSPALSDSPRSAPRLPSTSLYVPGSNVHAFHALARLCSPRLLFQPDLCPSTCRQQHCHRLLHRHSPQVLEGRAPVSPHPSFLQQLPRPLTAPCRRPGAQLEKEVRPLDSSRRIGSTALSLPASLLSR